MSSLSRPSIVVDSSSPPRCDNGLFHRFSEDLRSSVFWDTPLMRTRWRITDQWSGSKPMLGNRMTDLRLFSLHIPLLPVGATRWQVGVNLLVGATHPQVSQTWSDDLIKICPRLVTRLFVKFDVTLTKWILRITVVLYRGSSAISLLGWPPAC